MSQTSDIYFSQHPEVLLFSKIGFQNNASSSLSDWPIFSKLRYDWLRVLPNSHQFENLSKYSPKVEPRTECENIDNFTCNLPRKGTVFRKRLHLLLELVSNLLSKYSNTHFHPNQYLGDILVSRILPKNIGSTTVR